MEIRELEWFTTLAETAHVTAAADSLNIAQPTLSRALARLERRLGVRLFDRHQNRLRLNKYGEIFQAHALRAIDEIDRAEKRIAALVDPDSGMVSLGFLHSFGGWLIPDLLQAYRERMPSVAFELQGGAADAIVDEVRQGRIDIGFVAPEPAADDLVWLPMGDESLCLSVPQRHPLARRKRIAVADLATEVFIALRSEYGLRQVTDRLCLDAGFRPTIVLETTELSTLRSLVEVGLGVALVPSPRPGHSRPQGTAIDVPLRDKTALRPFGAICRKGGPNSYAAQRFLAFAQNPSHASNA